MRLSQQEIKFLCQSIDELRCIIPCELRLYGSRIDDSRRGGDIDLLLITASHQEHSALAAKRFDILTRMTKYLGERKIDLLVCHSDELSTDSFLQMIYPSSIRLCQWEA